MSEFYPPGCDICGVPATGEILWIEPNHPITLLCDRCLSLAELARDKGYFEVLKENPSLSEAAFLRVKRTMQTKVKKVRKKVDFEKEFRDCIESLGPGAYEKIWGKGE